MRLILCLFFLSFHLIGYGQSYVKNTDSLYNAVYSSKEFSKKNEMELVQTCNDLYRESVDKGDDKTALRALTTAIRIYTERGENSNVLTRIEKAMTLAREQDDNFRLSLLYCYLGRAFMKAGFFNKARNAFDAGLKISSQVDSKDSEHILKAQHYGGMAAFFENSNPTIGDRENTSFKDSMVYFAKKAYAEAKMISVKNAERPRWLGERARIVGSVLVATLDFGQGQKYLSEAENLLSGLNDKRFLIGLYRFKGLLIYNSPVDNRLKRTLDLYNESFHLSEIYDIPQESYFIKDALASLYSEMRMPVQTRIFADETKRIKYEMDKADHESVPLAAKIELIPSKRPYYFVILIGAITCLISAAIIYYFITRKKTRYASAGTEDEDIAPMDVQPHTDHIKQLLQLAKEDEKSFYIVFKQIFPDFQNKLLSINNELSVADLELCAYLKLNLQTKEIAQYRKNTISSVDNRKSRLRKKLNLPSDINLYVWIDNI